MSGHCDTAASQPPAEEIPVIGGVFTQRGHSANYYVVYPGNTPENHPPAEGCMINSKQHGVQNSGPWDPWQASHYQQGGCRVQHSEPWDPWIPVVENSRLFTQRRHSERCAPITCVRGGGGGERQNCCGIFSTDVIFAEGMQLKFNFYVFVCNNTLCPELLISANK